MYTVITGNIDGDCPFDTLDAALGFIKDQVKMGFQCTITAPIDDPADWPTPNRDGTFDTKKYFTPTKLSPARYLLLKVLVEGGWLIGRTLKSDKGDTLYSIDPVIDKWVNGVTEEWSATILTSTGQIIRAQHRKISDRGRAVWAHQQKLVKAKAMGVERRK